MLAALTESTVDLYGADLARQVGVECDGPLTGDAGRELTVRLRKDDTLCRGAESDR